MNRRLLQSDAFVLAVAVAAFAGLLPFAPGLATPGNLESILTALLPLALLATGQTFVLVTGGIDLSIAATVSLASVLGAQAVNLDSGWLRNTPDLVAVPSAAGFMLLTGAVVGFLNGIAVAAFRMPPFIVTLTASMFWGGLAIWITRSQGIGNLPPTFNALGGRTVPALSLALAALAAAHFLLSRTLLGRWLYAIGHNPATARVSGVPTRPATAVAYALAGTFAAAAAILLTGQAETGSPVLGQKLLLDVIAAAVIGGVSLFGGRGRILGACLGVLFIKVLDNGLNLLGLSYFVIMMVKGSVILLAALLDAWRTTDPATS